MIQEHREFYRDNGYLIVRGLFSPAQIARLDERLCAILEGRVAPAQGMLVMRDVMIAKGVVTPRNRLEAIAKLQDIYTDPVFFDFYTEMRMLDWAEHFVGPDFKLIHSMLINKPPNVDGRHPLHQDLLYFPFRPADAIVGCSVAIDRATKENGCLVVVPGSHRGEMLKHGNPEWEHLNFAYFGAEGVGEHTDRVHVELEVGDALFFHPLLLHGAGRNRTQGFRRSIIGHYASSKCRYLDDSNESLRGRPKVLVRGQEFPDGI